MLDGVYRHTDGEPVFVEASAPTDEALQALLHKNISRLMKLLTRRGVLIEEGNSASDEARSRCRRRLPRIEWVSPHVAWQKVFAVQGGMPRDTAFPQEPCGTSRA